MITLNEEINRIKTIMGLITETEILMEKFSSDEINDKYYSDIPKDIFKQIVNSDPTKKGDSLGKYGKWLLNLHKKGELKTEDLYKATEYLTIFNKVKNKLEQSDINKFNSLPELYNIIKQYEENPDEMLSNNEKEKEIKKGAKKVYEDNDWLVIVPETKESACYYGKGTQWCTSSVTKNDDGTPNYDKNQFDRYKKNGDLYININKKTGKKYQFYFSPYEPQLMDELDERLELPISKTLNMNDNIIDFYYEREPFSKVLFNDSFFDLDEGESIVSVNSDNSVIIKSEIDGDEYYIYTEKNGVKNGHSTRYKGDKILSQVQFVNDKLHGEQTYYNSDGTIRIKSYYVHGNMKKIVHYENGEIIKFYKYSDDGGIEHSEEIVDDKLVEKRYKNGILTHEKTSKKRKIWV